ncbi:Pentatricopeptide repeat-containing protein [Trichinella spiralis]|uniref:Pentatricopeptide repeat-containing protein n=1 Tax=Trichinella spiralis TaxID=6334 RepID=A0ABR3KAF8_TRISP
MFCVVLRKKGDGAQIRRVYQLGALQQGVFKEQVGTEHRLRLSNDFILLLYVASSGRAGTAVRIRMLLRWTTLNFTPGVEQTQYIVLAKWAPVPC